MSDGPLPHRVNIRKAVTRSARYAGTLDATQLPRFEGVLDPGKALQVQVIFGEDDEGQSFARIVLEAPVILECQRCLGPLARTLRSDSALGLVFDDEQARHLPSRYEPWIAIDEVDLWEIAAEELALALPVVSYHPDNECEIPAELTPGQTEQGVAAGTTENPFNVLSKLLDSGADEEKE